MSVELYLLKPRPDGTVLVPYSEEGLTPELASGGCECLASMKWAAYDRRLRDVGLGLTDELLPAALLVAGAEEGLSDLLMEISAPHWDFVKWTSTDCHDLDAFHRVWDAFERGDDWLGGDAAARVAAQALHRELCSFAYLFEAMSVAGKQGQVGWWCF
jgi:hypothetical protein